VKIGILAQVTGSSSADAQEDRSAAPDGDRRSECGGRHRRPQVRARVGDVKNGRCRRCARAPPKRLLGDDDVHFMLTGYASLTNFERST
jgi:branched-chain amino acid transport system substrate-binding protein